MRSIASYVAYLVVLSITSFFFYWFIKIWISMGRFTAADAYPGDISNTEKVFYSFVVPIVYGIILTTLSFLYRRFLLRFSVNLSAIFIFTINLVITIYFITQFRIFALS